MLNFTTDCAINIHRSGGTGCGENSYLLWTSLQKVDGTVRLCTEEKKTVYKSAMMLLIMRVKNMRF